ncbi:respiratory burst oxidase homolog protein A [Amborella trichopoda]|uniref:Uncharacterized protein n=1 Tax=Amborella trichopoda TaxID=13333 RepID=W1P7B1_AMBTC|nr:respiratory burst oxidase homolog protein A [Amborella trichopoda]ERN05757.1 hypothetical protein AMTR_s00006p00251470 [Amborella trichopoda]|eukprot:XP_006844082.1 respiratory burst oxidase homolog protein A [Amborella trichopoda]
MAQAENPTSIAEVLRRAAEQADLHYIELTIEQEGSPTHAAYKPESPLLVESLSGQAKPKSKPISQELKQYSQELKQYSQELKAEFKRITQSASAKLGSKIVGVKRLSRQKSGAEGALHGLRFISKATEDSDFKTLWESAAARFDRLASADGLLSRSDFGNCIGMKDSKEFAGQIFDALVRRRGTHSDAIDKHQLHEFCQQISDQSFDARLKIFFEMCDKNADGMISEEEVREIIMLTASVNQLSKLEEKAQEYAALIMEELDPNNRGYIELSLLEELLRAPSSCDGYTGYSQNLSQALSSVSKRSRIRKLSQEAKYFLDENWKRAWVVALWVTVMAGLFAWKFLQYRQRKAFMVMGYCLCMSKGGAETLKLNMALVLLPVCRNMITWLRSTGLAAIIPFDDNINFHKTIAGGIAMGVLVHVLSHLLCDFPRLTHANEHDYEEYLQMYFGNKRPTYVDLLKGVVGVTGIAMVILMAVAFLLATSWFRRKSIRLPWPLDRVTGFNAFWYSHHSFAIVYVLLIVHSWFLYLNKEWRQKTTWMYIAVPIILYCGERILRALRAGRYTVDILKAAIYPGNVLALHMTKPRRFKYKSGMYIFLQCPQISTFQWHPFSITSAPDDEHISVHIRTSGDWTQEMRRLFSEKMRPPPIGMSGLLRADNRCCDERAKSKLPELRIDGPYGAPAQNHKNYDVLMLIGIGIGATPFISILKDMLNHMKFQERKESMSCAKIDTLRNLLDLEQEFQGWSRDFQAKKRKRERDGPTRAFFYWVTREQGSFEWFKGVMNEIAEIDHNAVIEMHNYLTSVYEEGDARSALITMLQELNHAKNGLDIVSGTRVKTHFARPNWKGVFSKVASKNKDARIGVFYCGPLILAKELKALTHEFNHRMNTKFEFHKENF